MRAAPLLVIALALAGCAAPPEPGPGPPPGSGGVAPGGGAGPSPAAPEDPQAPAEEAPEWELGDAWTYTLRTADRVATHELVVFLADDEHWWLGLADRDLALEHALRDTNPLIGRIHYGILSPHEKGRHAGMYSFPLEDGKAWSGDLFGGTWQFQAAWDAARQRFAIEGAGANGSRIALDYDPAAEWFTTLRLARDGANLDLTLDDRRTGLTGTFHFLRGVDLYAGPGPAGPVSAALHVDEVPVQDTFDALGLSVRVEAAGPGSIAILDPSNQEQWRRELAAGDVVDELAEVPHMPGTWRVLYLGLAGAPVEVRIAGLEVHEGTV